MMEAGTWTSLTLYDFDDFDKAYTAYLQHCQDYPVMNITTKLINGDINVERWKRVSKEWFFVKGCMLNPKDADGSDFFWIRFCIHYDFAYFYRIIERLSEDDFKERFKNVKDVSVVY